MANPVTRALHRMLDVEPASSLRALAAEVDSLKTKVRVMKAGASGVPIIYGGYEYELNDQLRGTMRWDVYDNMESDPHIKGGLDSVILPLQTGKWAIKPASEDDPKDLEIAEFVSANLLRTTGDAYGREYWVQTSWSQRLLEILDFLKCGFAMFQKSTREVNGKVVYDRLQFLEPRSVDPQGWTLGRTDEVLNVLRTYRTGDRQEQYVMREPLEARQLALYPWDFRGARYEGRPRVRSAYGAFVRKDFIERAAVIWAQKVGAPMPVSHYPAGYSPADIANVRLATEAMRGQSPAEAYASFPKTTEGEKVEFEYVGAEHNDVDRMRGLIDGENGEIAHALGSKSRLLGETASGSKALGSEQGADEDVYAQAVALVVCELENHGVGNLPGLIQELVDWNFPGVKKYPELKVSRIGPWEDLSTLDPLIKAVQAKIVPKTASVMKQVTEKFGLSLSDEEYDQALEDERAAAEQAQANQMASIDAMRQGAAGGGSGKPDPAKQASLPGKEPPAKPTEGSLSVPDVSPLLQPAPGAARLGGRAPNVLEERTCSLAQIRKEMDVGADDVHQRLRVIRDQMIGQLQGHLKAGKVQRRNMDGLRRLRFRGASKASDALGETLRGIGAKGAAQVAAEIRRGKG